jgi:predicted RecB family nuclease
VQPAFLKAGQRRFEQRSNLGEWSYRVVDTKLAKETRAGTILQLSLYSELLGSYRELFPSILR